MHGQMDFFRELTQPGKPAAEAEPANLSSPAEPSKDSLGGGKPGAKTLDLAANALTPQARQEPPSAPPFGEIRTPRAIAEAVDTSFALGDQQIFDRGEALIKFLANEGKLNDNFSRRNNTGLSANTIREELESILEVVPKDILSRWEIADGQLCPALTLVLKEGKFPSGVFAAILRNFGIDIKYAIKSRQLAKFTPLEFLISSNTPF